MKSIGVIWAQYGPYHFARFAALRKMAGSIPVHAIEMANRTEIYQWNRSGGDLKPITLCPGAVVERLPFATLFSKTRRALAELDVDVCFLPGYWPRQPLAALLAAKSLGIRVVMMNESHAGTARPGRIGSWLKCALTRLFDAALIGGQPQKRYYARMGLPEEKIFTGYDAVDNDFFRERADAARAGGENHRRAYQLPEHYFLSLGRFVAKKNLTTLIHAYHQFLLASPLKQTHLVLVGSGEDEPKLRAVCRKFGMPVYDKTATERKRSDGLPNPNVAESDPPNNGVGVHFYGFRQIDENPIFYGLAEAFILPSLHEEWGLVVNEAMAAGLPVVVSETAGCAEDLLEPAAVAAQNSFPLESTLGGAAAGLPNAALNLKRRLRENGFLFDPTSASELGRILVLLESSASMRGAMGRASRRIVEKFSCGNFAANALGAAAAAVGRKMEHSAARRTSPSLIS